jgi:adenine-specific DNA-methyltransferase
MAAIPAHAAADTRAWERDIDQRVYRLYGSTPEEIQIVEEGAK